LNRFMSRTHTNTHTKNITGGDINVNYNNVIIRRLYSVGLFVTTIQYSITPHRLQ